MTKLKQLAHLLRSFRGSRSGMAAVEFAIVAPVLALGLVVMIDLGLAINEKITLDQTVRAGAEYAMNGVTDEDDLREMMLRAATGYSFSDDDSVRPTTDLFVDIDQKCSCSLSGIATSCTNICPNNLPSYSYFTLSARKTYEAIYIPNITLRSEMSVQTR